MKLFSGHKPCGVGDGRLEWSRASLANKLLVDIKRKLSNKSYHFRREKTLTKLKHGRSAKRSVNKLNVEAKTHQLGCTTSRREHNL